ncbi:MAG: ferrous iron transport protein B [Treponema sp.]|nr:ferrous iron transport protein B [Treponema sp.]
MSYAIALAGNPNCGKTSLFNELTGSKQHVGNWPGVTVDKKEGTYKKDSQYTILDLPGTYSLSPYSAEEVIARDYIVNEKPDCVINIIDSTCIERNLYLSLQIMETGVPTVLALNMMDEVEKRGIKIDAEGLSKTLGVTVVPIIARSGKGIEELMAAVANTIETGKKPAELELYKKIAAADSVTNADPEEIKADLRYTFIGEISSKYVVKPLEESIGMETTSDKLDKVLTNRWLALPIFALVVYLIFACTFSENFLFVPGLPSPGVWLAGVVESAWGWLTNLVAGGLEAAGAADWAMGLVVDGILGGIGAVLGFLPLVLVLYVLMSFLEDSGYMARVAFVMDRIFRRFGLSGRSFIPLLMGFGCGVPAIMATRTLESEKDRKITTIITAFMPCGAKLPIFAMFVATFFSQVNQTLVLFSIYMVSIVTAIIVSLILNTVVYKSAVSNFLMELPQYRLPTLKSVAIHCGEKLKGFAEKAGSVILVSTIVLWLLTNFNFGSLNGDNRAAAEAAGEEPTIMCQMNDSFLASIGGIIAPVFKPLGFGEWRPAVGVVSGWIAKEMVVVTFSQLYEDDLSPEYLESYFGGFAPEELEELGFEGGVYDHDTAVTVYSETILFEGADENALPTVKKDIKTPQAAYAYMIFNLLCMPCFAAVGAMKRELKTWKSTGGAIAIQMATAYVVSLLINLIGGLF